MIISHVFIKVKVERKDPSEFRENPSLYFYIKLIFCVKITLSVDKTACGLEIGVQSAGGSFLPYS